MAFSMAACGEKAADTEAASPTPEPTSTPTPEPATDSSKKLIQCDAQTNETIRKYNKAIKLANESGILDFPEESVRIMKRVEQDLTAQNGYCRVEGFFDGIQVLDYLDGMFKNFVEQCDPSSPLFSKGKEAANAISEAYEDMTQLFNDKQLLDYLGN